MKRGVMRGRRVWTVLLAIAFIGYFAAPALAAPHRGINNCGDFCLVVERDGSWHTSALFHIYSDGSAETIWLLGNEVGSVTYFEIHNRTTTAARAMVHWGDIDGEGSQNTAYAESLGEPEPDWLLPEGTPTQRAQFEVQLFDTEDGNLVESLFFTVDYDGTIDPQDPPASGDEGNGDDPDNDGNGDEPGSDPDEGNPGEPTGPGETDEDEYTAPKCVDGVIEGMVVDAETGAPIDGARVMLRNSDGIQYGGKMTTGEDGSFEKGHIARGSYTIKAWATGYESADASVDVGCDDTVSVRIELDPIEEEETTIEQNQEPPAGGPENPPTEDTTVVTIGPEPVGSGSLPKTGGSYLYLVLQGFTLVGTGAYLRRRFS